MGSFPAIAVSAGVGLLVCSVAHALSRATVASSHVLYLAGLLLIALPIFYRLISKEARSGERLALVCLLGLTLYAVKVLREPFLFTVADEFLHAYNADQIGIHHHLFSRNPTLPVSSYYPGLEGATSALMEMTGLSSFGAGIIIVGAARLTLCVGLFCLFARISGSPRIAGIGAAIYAANPNFLILGTQYSYQSLALPLLVVILWTLAERELVPPSWLRTWAVPAVLLIAAVVMTHHVTSYGLAIALLALSIAYIAVGRGWRAPNPVSFAALTIGLAVFWLIVVSSTALRYLGDIFGTALEVALDTLTGQAAFRVPFESSSDSALSATPIAPRLIAVMSVLILLACLPAGLRQVLRRHRRSPLALVLCLMAVGYFGALGFRLASVVRPSAAWEIGDRAGEFLFIGLAFVVAYAFAVGYERLESRRHAPQVTRGSLAAVFAVMLTGGVISGWPPWDTQLSQPIRVKADGHVIESEPLALARWANEHLRQERFVAPIAAAYTLLAPGQIRTYGAAAGERDAVDTFLFDPTLSNRQLFYLRNRDIRMVVTDRRRAADDFTRGYFFPLRPLPPRGKLLTPRGPLRKFRHIPTAGRIFDSGNIVVYDLEARG
jgi:hypothetical protein